MHGALANDDASAQQFAVSKAQVKWLDETMLAAGSPKFICGDRYTIADLQLFIFLSWVRAFLTTHSCWWFRAFALLLHDLMV